MESASKRYRSEEALIEGWLTDEHSITDRIRVVNWGWELMPDDGYLGSDWERGWYQPRQCTLGFLFDFS